MRCADQLPPTFRLRKVEVCLSEIVGADALGVLVVGSGVAGWPMVQVVGGVGCLWVRGCAWMSSDSRAGAREEGRPYRSGAPLAGCWRREPVYAAGVVLGSPFNRSSLGNSPSSGS
jgi:hypothetical protein